MYIHQDRRRSSNNQEMQKGGGRVAGDRGPSLQLQRGDRERYSLLAICPGSIWDNKLVFCATRSSSGGANDHVDMQHSTERF